MVNASEVSQDELGRYYEALGPIRDLVLDDSLTEVMVNGHENIYVERNGKIPSPIASSTMRTTCCA